MQKGPKSVRLVTLQGYTEEQIYERRRVRLVGRGEEIG